MADENNNAIIYTINNWEKGEVLTAEKLNASEQALKAVIDRINGAVVDSKGNTTDTIDDAMALVTKETLNNMINGLDYSQPANDAEDSNTKPNNLKTISLLEENNGKITVEYQEIAKANGSGAEATLGVVQAGTNLSASNGTLNVIDSPNFNGNLTVNGSSTLTGATTLNNTLVIAGKLTASNDVEFGTDTETIENNITSHSYSTAIINANTTINGTANIPNSLIVGTDTVTNQGQVNESHSYAGTSIFNTTSNILHGNTTIDNLISSTTTINNSLTFGTNATISFGRKTNSTVGYKSITFGTDAIADGYNSHAEGIETIASGDYAWAQGAFTQANGGLSTAFGSYTIANYLAQHVFGQFNIADISSAQSHERGTYIEIVGNGTSNNERSNARTLDWSGNEWLGSSLTIGSFNIANTLYPNYSETTQYYLNDKVNYEDSAWICTQTNTGNQPENGSTFWSKLYHNNEYAFIIGNGIDENHRHNALTVDWEGNMTLSGNITLTSTYDNSLIKELTAELIEELEIASPLIEYLPTTAGIYNLKVQIIDSEPVYSWVLTT